MKSPKKIVLPVVLVVIGVAGAAALFVTRTKAPPLKVEEQDWVVEVQPVKLESVAPVLPLYGRVETPRAAKLAAALSAEVRAVPVREGQSVTKDQLLVQLDDRDVRLTLASREADVAEMQAAVDSAQQTHTNDLTALEHEKALLSLTEKALQRTEDVAAKQLVAKSAVDDARKQVETQQLSVASRQLAVDSFPAQLAQLKARLSRAEAARDGARLDLARAHVTAPFAGRIAKVAVAPGDRVNVNSELVQLYDVQSLELRAQIPAPKVAALRQALAHNGRVEGSGISQGQTVKVVFDRLSGQVEQGSGGVDGLFRITAGRDELALGQFVDLTISLASLPRVAVLPAPALYGMNRVYVMRDGRMAAVEVQVMGERREAGRAQLLVQSNALREGDRVIVTHLPNAIDGLRVKTAEPAPPAAKPAAS